MAALCRVLGSTLPKSKQWLRAAAPLYKSINLTKCNISTSNNKKDVSVAADEVQQSSKGSDFSYGQDGNFGDVEKAKVSVFLLSCK